MADSHKAFFLQLEKELAVARTLHRLLCEERKLLDPPEIKALTDIQQEKLKHLNALKELSNQRCNLLRDLEIPLDKHCYLAPQLQSESASDNTRLASLWQDLADQFEENRRITAVLANIVLTARQRTQSLMKILRGKKNTPNLYTKSGLTQSGSKGLGYAKA